MMTLVGQNGVSNDCFPLNTERVDKTLSGESGKATFS